MAAWLLAGMNVLACLINARSVEGLRYVAMVITPLYCCCDEMFALRLTDCWRWGTLMAWRLP